MIEGQWSNWKDMAAVQQLTIGKLRDEQLNGSKIGQIKALKKGSLDELLSKSGK